MVIPKILKSIKNAAKPGCGIRNLALAVAAMACVSHPAFAVVYPANYLSDDPLFNFRRAEVVMMGQIAYQWAEMDPQDRSIRTYALVEVEFVNKGSLNGEKVIRISVRGGFAEGLCLVYSTGNVEFETGERVELMLRFNQKLNCYVLIEDPYGYRSLENGIFRKRGRINEYSTFGSWGAGATVRFRVNTSSNLPTNITGNQFLSAVQAGVSAWPSHANLAWSYLGTTSRTTFPGDTELDGIVDFFFQPTIDGGAIGLTRTWYEYSGQIVDADVAFDRDQVLWSANKVIDGPSSVDLISVTAHESGHALGMRHSSESYPEPNPVLFEATMYFVTFSGSISGRDLNSDDIAGIQSRYGPPSFPMADANSDGRINALDGVLLAYYIANPSVPVAPLVFARLDLDADFALTISDWTILSEYLAGNRTSLP
jgi:hypothetical protein